MSLPSSGYGWIAPGLIDWAQLSFQLELTDRTLFGNHVLRDTYFKHGEECGIFLETSKTLDLAVEWLLRHEQNTHVFSWLLLWICHLCLQQFRIDLWAKKRTEIKLPDQARVKTGDFSLTIPELTTICKGKPKLLIGSTTHHKEVPRLLEWIWGFDDGRERTHWGRLPFRQLYRQVSERLRRSSEEVRREYYFQRRFSQLVMETCYVLPSPNGRTLLVLSKDRERQWFSIKRREVDESRTYYSPRNYEWAKGEYVDADAPKLPSFMKWSLDRWRRWIQQHTQPATSSAGGLSTELDPTGPLDEVILSSSDEETSFMTPRLKSLRPRRKPGAVDDTGEDTDYYPVLQLLDHKTEGRMKMFLVEWEGWPDPVHYTWQTKTRLRKDIPELIEAYEREHHPWG